MNRTIHRRDISEEKVLRLCHEWQAQGCRGEGAMHHLTAEYPFKVVLRRLEQMVDQDLLEYGVSLNFPWLTEKGMARMRELTQTA